MKADDVVHELMKAALKEPLRHLAGSLQKGDSQGHDFHGNQYSGGGGGGSKINPHDEKTWPKGGDVVLADSDKDEVIRQVQSSISQAGGKAKLSEDKSLNGSNAQGWHIKENGKTIGHVMSDGNESNSDLVSNIQSSLNNSSSSTKLNSISMGDGHSFVHASKK